MAETRVLHMSTKALNLQQECIIASLMGARQEKVVWASLPQLPSNSIAIMMHACQSSKSWGHCLCFLDSASSAAASSDEHTALRIKGVNREVSDVVRI